MTASPCAVRAAAPSLVGALRRMRFALAGIIAAVIAAVGAPASIAATQTPLTQDDVIMMILTDRYPDGDSSNNDFGRGEYVPGNMKFYQGGDWQGIITSRISV